MPDFARAADGLGLDESSTVAWRFQTGMTPVWYRWERASARVLRVAYG